MPSLRRFLPGPLVALGLAALLGAAAVRAETDERGRTVHTVYPGQTVGKIARRYNVTVDALRQANHLRHATRIRPGDRLVIPDGKEEEPETTHRGRGDRWQDYAGHPKRRGYVVLFSPTKHFRGVVLTAHGKLIPKARESIEHLFASWRTGMEHDIEPRLIRLVVQLSDTFAGRPIRVVSGYREHSFAEESKHKIGRAFDFSIPGIPNAVLRDYLRTLPHVGVGYYPNSTHVHLDVRDLSAYWVDTAGPGEPPKYAGHARPDEEQGEAADVPQGVPETPGPDTDADAPDDSTPPPSGPTAAAGVAKPETGSSARRE